MPIYAYRCAACGHAKDVLQKLSDAVLTVCPACAAPRFEKQVTAAGFQLKGSGWYATDFRNGPATKPDAKTAPAQDGSDAGAKPASGSEPAAPAAGAPAAPAAAPAAAPPASTT
jgi:putative FmdB family regulatory protein